VQAVDDRAGGAIGCPDLFVVLYTAIASVDLRLPRFAFLLGSDSILFVDKNESASAGLSCFSRFLFEFLPTVTAGRFGWLSGYASFLSLKKKMNKM
jgi:hypothetical protein